MRRKIVPKITKKMRVMVEVAAVKRGLRKKRRSSMGSLTLSSQAAKAPMMTVARPKATKVRTESQPRLGASMMA